MEGLQDRASDDDGLDDFPTPKWATRGFIEHCIPHDKKRDLGDMVVWEPAANRGCMSDVLKEYFGTVICSDVHDYGVGFPVIDFLTGPTPMQYGQEVDFIITNPPFNRSLDFFRRWRDDMPEVRYLFMLLRLLWMQGTERYEACFAGPENPWWICPYVERVRIVEGRVEREGSTRMPYAWFMWDRQKSKYQPTRTMWIPPCKKDYDRDDDWK